MKAVAGALAALKSGEGLKGQLMRGGVGSVAVKTASTGLNLILAIVLARLLGAEGFGVYSFIFALVTILAIPAQMGLPNLVVRETAKAQVAERWDVIKGLWRWSSVVALGMSAALIILGGALAFVFVDHFTLLQVQTFWWALALVPLIALGNLRGAALRGLRHVVQGQLPEFILRPLFLIALVLVFLHREKFGPADAMMLHLWASGGAFIVGAMLLLRAKPAAMDVEKTATIEPKLWMASAFPLAMIDGMHIVNDNVGMVVLGLFGKVDDVGLLRIALQGAALISFGITAANIVVAPYIAKLYLEKDRAKLQKILTVSARLVLAIAVPSTLIFFFWGKYIITAIFGAEYVDAHLALMILAVGRLANAFAANAGMALNMCGYERGVLRALAIGAVLNVLLTVALVPLTGLLGAAVASTVGLFIWNIMLWTEAMKRLGIDTSALNFQIKLESTQVDRN